MSLSDTLGKIKTPCPQALTLSLVKSTFLKEEVWNWADGWVWFLRGNKTSQYFLGIYCMSGGAYILRENNNRHLLSICDISDDVVIYWGLITTPWGRYSSYSYVTSRQTEGQRGKITCPGSLSVSEWCNCDSPGAFSFRNLGCLPEH